MKNCQNDSCSDPMLAIKYCDQEGLTYSDGLCKVQQFPFR